MTALLAADLDVRPHEGQGVDRGQGARLQVLHHDELPLERDAGERLLPRLGAHVDALVRLDRAAERRAVDLPHLLRNPAVLHEGEVVRGLGVRLAVVRGGRDHRERPLCGAEELDLRELHERHPLRQAQDRPAGEVEDVQDPVAGVLVVRDAGGQGDHQGPLLDVAEPRGHQLDVADGARPRDEGADVADVFVDQVRQDADERGLRLVDRHDTVVRRGGIRPPLHVRLRVHRRVVVALRVVEQVLDRLRDRVGVRLDRPEVARLGDDPGQGELAVVAAPDPTDPADGEGGDARHVPLREEGALAGADAGVRLAVGRGDADDRLRELLLGGLPAAVAVLLGGEGVPKAHERGVPEGGLLHLI